MNGSNGWSVALRRAPLKPPNPPALSDFSLSAIGLSGGEPCEAEDPKITHFAPFIRMAGIIRQKPYVTSHLVKKCKVSNFRRICSARLARSFHSIPPPLMIFR